MYPRTLTISSVGQITLPKKIRDLLGVKNGEKVAVDVNEGTKSVTFKRQMTHEEVFAELERLSKNRPKPSPRTRHMTVGEMSLEQAKHIKGDTWV